VKNEQQRSLAFTFGVILAVFVGLFLIFYITAEQAYLKQNERLVNMFVDHESEKYLTPQSFAGNDQDIEAFKGEIKITALVHHVTLINNHGEVVHSDDTTLQGKEFSFPELEAAINGAEGHSSPPHIHKQKTESRSVETYIPVEKNGEVIGVVVVHQGMELLDKIFIRLITVLGIFFLIAIVLGTIGINILFSKMTASMKQKQQRLERKNVKLGKMDKLKNEFISNMNHEIRNPLTAIKAYVDFLRDGDMGTLTKQQEEGLEIIDGAVQSLEHTINDMLDWQRLEAGIKLKVSKYAVEEIVTTVVNETRPMIKKKGLHFHLNIAMGLTKVKCDLMQTRGVLRNLLSNATKFTNKGGITVSVTSDGAFVRFAVSDTGIGIEEELQGKLFNQFYQVEQKTTSKIKGSGLGLNISKKVVEMQKGHIYVESSLGKGSTFSFTVPRA
jgi:signal transduction histidine kinase